jgi:hypothetical protein
MRRLASATPLPAADDRAPARTGLLARVRRAPALSVALAVMIVATVGLTLLHASPRPSVAPAAAIHDALRSPVVRRALARSGWNSAHGTSLDGHLELVTFQSHGRVVVQALVRSSGSVDQVIDFLGMKVPYGDWVAYQPVMLIGLALLFVLMTAVMPLRRIRNLDVAALLTLVVSVVAFQHRYVTGSLLVALPALGYLIGRCAWRGLAPPATARAPAAVPLFEQLTRSWEPQQRVRMLRAALLVLALIYLMVGVSSADGVDVIYAAMEGATRIIHGLLPYGHLPGDVVHGDTYPILSYALYAPLALLAPVPDTFSSVDLELAVTVVAALLIGASIARAQSRAAAGPRHRRREAQLDTAGPRAALAWLSFPVVLIVVSTGTTDVMLALMLAFAVLLWRRPALSTGLLAVAGWFKLAPFALLPLWLAPLRGRRLAAALAAVAAVSAATLGLVMALGGPAGISAMVHAVAYQFERGSLQSFWIVLHLSAFQGAGQAAALALIAGAAVALHRDSALAGDRRRVAALTAAILIALQLAANYWAFLYVVWFLPLIGLSLLSDEGIR